MDLHHSVGFFIVRYNKCHEKTISENVPMQNVEIENRVAQRKVDFNTDLNTDIELSFGSLIGQTFTPRHRVTNCVKLHYCLNRT